MSCPRSSGLAWCAGIIISIISRRCRCRRLRSSSARLRLRLRRPPRLDSPPRSPPPKKLRLLTSALFYPPALSIPLLLPSAASTGLTSQRQRGRYTLRPASGPCRFSISSDRRPLARSLARAPPIPWPCGFCAATLRRRLKKSKHASALAGGNGV